MRPRPAARVLGTRGGRGRPHRLARILIPLLLVLCGWLVWPYVTLWRLDRALVRDDQATLASLVDLGAVRDGIRRSLDKDARGTLGPFSDRFIDWLQQGLRRHGTSVLEEELTLAWVREQLLANSPPGGGRGLAISRAFFDDPLHFSLRLGGPSQAPVVVRMRFTGIGWRVSALSY